MALPAPAKHPLLPALCPPKQRLKGFTEADYIRMIRWHERQAEQAMNNLSCGSDNYDYRVAHEHADAHWGAAALMRLRIGAPE